MGSIDRSTVIHFSRAIAAAVVALGHLRNVFFDDYKSFSDPGWLFKVITFVSGLGSESVMIFFLLSGWLVGGSLLKARTGSHPYRSYGLARIARLWSVLVPLFCIQVLFRMAGFYPNQAEFFSTPIFFGNLLGLQSVYFPSFGDNFPLWSLANETAYYAWFLILVFCVDARSSLWLRLFVLAMGCCHALLLNQTIALYFVIWLCGAGLSRVDASRYCRFASLFFVLFVCVVFYKRTHNIVMNFPLDLTSTMVFGLMLTTLKTSEFQSAFNRAGEFFASFSFSLYVVHVPLILLLGLDRGPHHDLSLLRLVEFGGAYLLILIVAYCFYFAFESHHNRIRALLNSLFEVKGDAAVKLGSS